jgi:hypothetical protein
LDLSDWKYFLTSFNDGEFFDINFLPGKAHMSEMELSKLGELLAASELGEEIFLSYVGRINVVPVETPTTGANPIDYLYPQFMEQLKENSRH